MTFKENFGGEVIPGNRVKQGSHPNKAWAVHCKGGVGVRVGDGLIPSLPPLCCWSWRHGRTACWSWLWAPWPERRTGRNLGHRSHRKSSWEHGPCRHSVKMTTRMDTYNIIKCITIFHTIIIILMHIHFMYLYTYRNANIQFILILFF